MNVLVTGATGFVGSHLVDYILENHPSVLLHTTKRYHLSRMDNCDHFYDRVNWIDVNLREPHAVLQMVSEIRPSIIFHMAAESFVSPSWRHPCEYMDANYKMTVNILEAVRLLGLDTKVHLPGSGEEYGEIDENNLPIRPETALNPVNPYAVTKIAQDMIGFVYWKSYGVNVIRTRAFNHEGPRRHFMFGIPWYAYQIARMERGLQPFVLETGDTQDKRNFTDVRDMVKAYWLAAKHCEPGTLYLIGQEDKEMIYTFSEVIDLLISLSSIEKNRVEVRRVDKYVRPTNVPFLISDISRFNAIVEWKRDYDMRTILVDTLDYWRDRVANGRH